MTQIDRVVEAVEETLKGHTVALLAKKTLPRLDLPKVRRNRCVLPWHQCMCSAVQTVHLDSTHRRTGWMVPYLLYPSTGFRWLLSATEDIATQIEFFGHWHACSVAMIDACHTMMWCE